MKRINHRDTEGKEKKLDFEKNKSNWIPTVVGMMLAAGVMTAAGLVWGAAAELANNDLVVQKGSWGTWF